MKTIKQKLKEKIHDHFLIWGDVPNIFKESLEEIEKLEAQIEEQEKLMGDPDYCEMRATGMDHDEAVSNL